MVASSYKGTYSCFPKDSKIQGILSEIVEVASNDGQYYVSLEVGYHNKPYELL